MLSPEQAREQAADARWVAAALDLEAGGVAVASSPRPISDLDRALVAVLRQKTRNQIARELRGIPFRRERSVADWREFFHELFYWFSHPEQRTGPHLNYAACRASGRADIDPTGFVVIRCGPAEPADRMAPGARGTGEVRG